MIKPSAVVFISDELENNFNELREDDPIKKGIVRAIKDLKVNAFLGIQVPKRLFPKEYITKYGINNRKPTRNRDKKIDFPECF